MATHTSTFQDDSFTADDRRVSFSYNTVYRPEFVSAAVISTLVSGIGLWNLPRGAPSVTENVHSLPGVIVYVVLLFLLVKLTLGYRRRFAPIVAVVDSQFGPLMQSDSFEESMRISDVEQMTESLSRFFGRRLRVMTIVDSSLRVLTIDEMLYGYDRLMSAIHKRGRSVTPEVDGHENAFTESQRLWHRRHANFLASENPVRFHSNTPFVVCLILLLIVDGLFNVIAQNWLVATQHAELIVYLTPASLVVSALATRFGYYYLFTAVSMNPQKKR